MVYATKRAVAYIRTSTDDRDQNPERQADVIRAWASREGVDLAGFVVDEGTSGSKVAPFARRRFAEAIRLAKEVGAGALVVEAQDRFTRADSEGFFVYRYLLREEHGLDLWSCTLPLAQQGKSEGRLMAVMQAESSAAWVQRHTQAVVSGMARAKAEGKHVGRPSKPPLTDEEFQWVATILAEGDGRRHGMGLRAAAHTISRHRGATEAHDPTTRRKRSVSARWVERQLLAKGWCRACWSVGRRDAAGDFHPGTCPEHLPGIPHAAQIAAIGPGVEVSERPPEGPLEMASLQ